ncbi:MAG TPA: hypothetical protein VGL61_19185 [Kofleriaceae bacterium]|jgi:uncharacterized lipoprotein YbaY
MKHAALFALLLAGCGSDTMMATSTPDAPAMTQVTNVTTSPTADVTWSGTIRVQNSITIPSGVTVTVAAGATLQVAAAARITIAGTLAIAGTKAQKVTIEGLATDDWAGLSIPTGGAFTMTYGEYTGGNIDVAQNGSFTVTDSELSRVSSGTDLLTSSGGNIDVEYSWLGQPVGQSDTTHCDMHFEGGSPTLTIMHDNISTAAYGVMFYSGVNASFTYNNWFSNGIQVAATGAVTGDFSNGWFDKSPPSGTGLTASDLASAMIADAGPR